LADAIFLRTWFLILGKNVTAEFIGKGILIGEFKLDAIAIAASPQ